MRGMGGAAPLNHARRRASRGDDHPDSCGVRAARDRCTERGGMRIKGPPAEPEPRRLAAATLLAPGHGHQRRAEDHQLLDRVVDQCKKVLKEHGPEAGGPSPPGFIVESFLRGRGVCGGRPSANALSSEPVALGGCGMSSHPRISEPAMPEELPQENESGEQPRHQARTWPGESNEE